MKRIFVYDGLLRFFHWGFAFSVVSALYIAKNVDSEAREFSWHMLLGLGAGVFILIRWVWGYWGGAYARWRNMPLGLSRLISYFRSVLQRQSPTEPGHVPASAWAGILMMVSVAGLVSTGVLMTTGAKEEWEDLHEWFANGLLVLIGLHLIGLWVHAVQFRDRFWLSMISGYKRMNSEVTPVLDVAASRARVGFGVFILAALIAGIWTNYDAGTRTLNLGLVSLSLGEAEEE